MLTSKRSMLKLSFFAACGLALLGCHNKKKVTELTVPPRYATLPPKIVPDYLKGTVLERCELTNIAPFNVSGFGLVANLRGTGDTFAGTAVREYIRGEMVKRGFGSRQQGLENMQPEDILKDPRFAIVRVDGFIPPGVRKQQRFDIYVSALNGNNTSSLAHGDLYRTDLKVNGANLQDPEYAIDIWATGEGSVFVNPAYALSTDTEKSEARASLRQGTILNGGVAQMDRPIGLRLRQPQLSLSRAIEHRIDQAFQDTHTAAAHDEGTISIFVPEKYGSHWEHFAQVVMHLYFNGSPEFAAVKTKQLVDEAQKPDAPLLDISYCWEAMGPTILPLITPLMTSDKPPVAFAAARAAAFLGDVSAGDVLAQMAGTANHPFQLTAVQTLAELPSSPAINQMLRTLLDNDQTLVRLAAYRALAEAGDSAIVSRPIGEKFLLDLIPGRGAPLIFATRTGTPRIALFGTKPSVGTPVMFSAMNNKLTISNDDRRLLNVFYRGPELRRPVSITSSTDLAELIARLGGEGAAGEQALNFNYCDVVSLLGAMSDQKHLWASDNGQTIPVSFQLQQSPGLQQKIDQAPIIPEQAPPVDKLSGPSASVTP